MVIRKNPARERTLLLLWSRGVTAREAARKTGIPEGSVNGYYAKFNKNPEKYKKTVTEIPASSLVEPRELLNDIRRIQRTGEVVERHHKLMGEGKYVDANAAIQAEINLDLFVSKVAQASDLAFLKADLQKYQALLPGYVKDQLKVMQNEGRLTESYLNEVHAAIVSSSFEEKIKGIVLKEIKDARDPNARKSMDELYGPKIR